MPRAFFPFAARFHGALPSMFLRLCVVLAAAALSGCSKPVDLQTRLNDSEANEIVTLLNRHGIRAEKHATKEGVTLTVQETEIASATQAMNAAGLPRRQLSNLGQVFKKEGMISTPMEERVRYIHALSAELEYTLQQFDRVVSARVHVVLPERVAPGEPIQPSSAAVFVKYIPPLDEDMVTPRIRNLVAGSIPGLGGEEGRSKVSVVLAAGEPAAPAVEWTTVGPFRVLADSAGSVRTTLIGMLVLVLAGLGGAAALAARDPNIVARIKRLASRAGKKEGEKANSQAADVSAAPGQ